jgi:hypothetical protein
MRNQEWIAQEPTEPELEYSVKWNGSLQLIMYILGKFEAFLDFQFLTIEFGLSKEFQDQMSADIFLYFYVFQCINEYLGPNKRKSHQIGQFFFI